MNDEFELWNLQVETVGDEDSMVCKHNLGVAFEVRGEDIIFAAGRPFSMYALAAILPLLPAKQRITHENDWMTTDADIACPDPNCGARFHISRTGKTVFRHSDTTVVPLKKTSMIDVPRVELAPGYSVANIINGCWQLSPDHGGGPSSPKHIKNHFSELVDHGFTTFDCADIYSGTEETLGEFRRSLPDGDKIQIHTKFVPNKNSLGHLSDTKIDAAIDLSRKKLGVDCLDLVQFHWWDYDVPGLERMYERLIFAKSIGKIRLLGVTNFNTKQLQILTNHDASIVSVQTQFSLLDRRPEKRMCSFCVGDNIGMLSYGVLAGGFLSENYLDRAMPTELNRSQQKYRLIIDDAGGWEYFQQLLATLDKVAKKHGADIQSIASRWVLDQPGVVAIVLGVGKQSRAVDNQGIGDICLDAQDRQRIDECLVKGRTPHGDPYDVERDIDNVHNKIIKTDLQDSVAQ